MVTTQLDGSVWSCDLRLCIGIVLVLIVGSLEAISLDQQDPLDFLIVPESSTSHCNCTTTESPLMFLHPPFDNEANAHRSLDGENDDIVIYDDFRSNDRFGNSDEIGRNGDVGIDDYLKNNEDDVVNNYDERNNDENGNLDKIYGAIPTTVVTNTRETNMSHLKTLRIPENWDNAKPTLDFPKTPPDERYRMAALHLDKGLFAFDFLEPFLSSIQPHDVPPDLMRDVVENRITAYKLVSESLHMEVGFVALVGVCCILACVIPGTELWLACRPIRGDYKPSRHPGFLAFLLSVSVFILGAGMVAILVCNEASSSGIEKIPLVVETALQDLSDYHSGTTVQMRRCLTRSLDVASEAILADLDNVEELLGKPVQQDLATETGLDVALDALLDVANATQELASQTKTLLKEGDKASEQGLILSREMDNLKQELENTIRDCPMQDRQLCATLNPSGFGVALRLDRLLRDDRLLRLRDTARDNLTEAGRQARGEYFYVPHHVARNTLDARNRVRREISSIRARIFDEARNIESSGSELTKHLEATRRLTNYVVPYITTFEQSRWLIGMGTIFAIFIVWILLVGALCCRCSASEHRVRSTLLCGVLTSCVVSVGLWGILISALAVSSHTEMLLCRPLHDPDFRTLETVLESKAFLGRRLSFPLKDLFEKCHENEAAYPAFQLGNSMKLEQLTAHWTWSGLSSSMSKLKVDLKGLKIFTPNLQEKLQILLYACGPNLTEHKNTIRGPILRKDLNALSDQVYNVAKQLNDRRSARKLEEIRSTIRLMMTRRIVPLTKLQGELVDRLTGLELHLQPLQRQVNQSISHLKTIQYYINNQGEKIAQLRSKKYVERLSSYLDQWRVHVLSEMGSGVAKCRPLWDILQGMRFLLCQHILGPMDGFWFSTLVCAVVMMFSTPTAHTLASVYKRPSSGKHLALLPSRNESPDTVVIDRDTWRTPDPPPPPPRDSW